MAYNQVAVYGMNKKIGLLSYPPQERKQYGSQTAQIIDREVRKIVDSAYERTINLLTEKKALVEKLALALLDKEVNFIFKADHSGFLNPRLFKMTLSEIKEIVMTESGSKSPYCFTFRQHNSIKLEINRISFV